MSESTRPDRRQSPRARLGSGVECRLELRTRVRLLDISLSGTLLGTDIKLPVGTKAQLRSGVSANTFAPEVQVKRIAEPSSRNATTGLGTAFTSMDERSRKSLEEFLKKAST